MTQMSGKDTTVSVTLPKPVYSALEAGSTNRGMTLPEYIASLLVTHPAVNAVDVVGTTVTDKKPKSHMKDPIAFLRKNIEKANPFTARLSDVTTIAIPVGVPMNIYDLLVNTDSVGCRDDRASDIFDGKHCRINAIVNNAGGSYDVQYTKYQVVPSLGSDPSMVYWTVYTYSAHFPTDRHTRCCVMMNVLSGDVLVQSDDSDTAGVVMQFRFK